MCCTLGEIVSDLINEKELIILLHQPFYQVSVFLFLLTPAFCHVPEQIWNVLAIPSAVTGLWGRNAEGETARFP